VGKKIRVKVTMREETWAEVKRRAKAEGNDGSVWVRRAVEERLERELAERKD
jgi:hypothetical protein